MKSNKQKETCFICSLEKKKKKTQKKPFSATLCNNVSPVLIYFKVNFLAA